jgi:P4 family phage/plasmid primase-like protien
MTNNLEHAAMLAALGWRVHPLRPGSKLPMLPGWQHAATNDAATVAAWWTETPAAGIGIATGAPVIVLDVDIHGKPGAESLAALIAEHGPLPQTLTARTASGGLHYYFASSEPIRNSAGKVGKALDVRGAGGYVVAPPTVVDGRPYSWADLSPIATAPAWLVTAALAAAPVSTAPAGEPVEITAELLEDLRDALTVLDADSRDQWIAAGAALRSLGEAGRELWVSWSATSEKHNADTDPDTFETIGHDSTGPAAIFAAAAREGWQNPAAMRRASGVFGQSPIPATGTSTSEPIEAASSPSTNLANAHRIVRHWGDRLLFVPNVGWHVREASGPWRCDELAARRLVQGLGRIIAAEAAGIASQAAAEDDKERREARQKAAAAMLKWAAASEGAKVLDHSLSMAAALLNCPAGDMDADTDVLGTPSGVLDLRTGQCRPYAAADRITKTTAVDFDPDATASTWTRFVSEIMGSDAELIEYVHRLAGYALSGRRDEHLLPICWGSGANGKSTYLGALMYVLGGYAGAAAPGLLIQRFGNEHPTALADLQGLRLVIASETGEGGRLNEEQVKLLTGGEAIKARRMARDFYQFQPSHLLLLQTNHRPQVKGTDAGIWRRLRLVPFNVTVPEDRRDVKLPEKLRAEAAGILAWCWRGWLAYRAHGFNKPEAIEAATNEYRTSSDVVGAWLADCCEIDPTATTATGDLYASYSSWCHTNGEYARAQKELSERLGERGFQRFKTRAGWRWRGVALCSPFGKSIITEAPVITTSKLQ